MNWQEILIILVPILGLMSWVYSRIEKKADERHASMEKKFDMVFQELKSIRDDIHQIDKRLTKLEGRFDERGYWESREFRKTGTEDKK